MASACRWHTESTEPSGKRTWAHTCTETPGAGNNKDNFLNCLLIQRSLHISQCCSSPQLTQKTCSQTHLPSMICLGGKRKKEQRKTIGDVSLKQEYTSSGKTYLKIIIGNEKNVWKEKVFSSGEQIPAKGVKPLVIWHT